MLFFFYPFTRLLNVAHAFFLRIPFSPLPISSSTSAADPFPAITALIAASQAAMILAFCPDSVASITRAWSVSGRLSMITFIIPPHSFGDPSLLHPFGPDGMALQNRTVESPGSRKPDIVMWQSGHCQSTCLRSLLKVEYLLAHALTGLKQRAMCELSGKGILAIIADAILRFGDFEP